ncbi:MAG: hypothetical protein DI539_04275 [Flavobacterium psychrophilum]|nr:MAG: hypothetical protein DI539_04275 [Flavobacterium psychrophilum]
MKYLLSLSLIVLFLSCNKTKDSKAAIKNDTIVVYNEMIFAAKGGYKSGNKKILKIIDTACINGKERANKMTLKGLYTYYYGAGFNCTEEKQEYVKKAFLKKGIRIGHYFVSCLGDPASDKFGFNCYEKAMNQEFEKKYGKVRIDSMEQAYIKLYYEYSEFKRKSK